MRYGFRKIPRNLKRFFVLFCNFYWLPCFARQGFLPCFSCHHCWSSTSSSYFIFFVLIVSSPGSCVFLLGDAKRMNDVSGDWPTSSSEWCDCFLHSYLSFSDSDSVLGRRNYVFTLSCINESTVSFQYIEGKLCEFFLFYAMLYF